jgi:hypothetical protein
MFGIDDAVVAASSLVTAAINKVWPDPTDKAKAEAITIQAASDAALATMKQSMSVMLAEASSSDKWTSRARPSMMYVMYVMILASIPMGVIFAFAPEHAQGIIAGVQKWLAAIPDTLWQMFGFCFLGYTGGRTFEKIKGVAK